MHVRRRSACSTHQCREQRCRRLARHTRGVRRHQPSHSPPLLSATTTRIRPNQLVAACDQGMPTVTRRARVAPRARTRVRQHGVDRSAHVPLPPPFSARTAWLHTPCAWLHNTLVSRAAVPRVCRCFPPWPALPPGSSHARALRRAALCVALSTLAAPMAARAAATDQWKLGMKSVSSR